LLVAGLSAWPLPSSADATDARPRVQSLDDPEDPQNLLLDIKERRGQRDSLFPASPLRWLHEIADPAEQALYDRTRVKLGFTLANLNQWLSDSMPGEDSWGTGTNADLVARWEPFSQGWAADGELFAHLQGRWDHGTTAPEDLGVSAGSAIQTGNAYSPYESPEVIVRNLYWQQGEQGAGWAFRVGKITPDATLATSAHLATATTFLTAAGVGSFAIAHADSGLGAVGAWYPNDRVSLVGLISDANGDRSDWGHLGAGDYFTAAQLGVKIAPRTEKAGYSKLVLWHTDGTEDEESSNGSLGPSGWGYFLKLEQELTADGRAIAIAKYGRSFDRSAIYEHVGGISTLLYDPPGPARMQHDLVGLAFNAARPMGLRTEYNVEVFYRFPVFPLVDLTLSYQSVINPALDPDNNHFSAYSIRIRSTF